MAKIWIDALTPKQIIFFNELRKHLDDAGFEILFTTREFRETIGLVKLKKIPCKTVGKHGGASLKDKLIASTRRILDLIEIVSSEDITLAISFSSPECARVAFGLGIPHIAVNDSPHSKFVAKLTIPLSKYLLSPKVIPKNVWVNFGISKDRIIQYNALDPVAWLKNFRPNDRVISDLNLDLQRSIIVIRETETYASYLRGLVESITPICETFVPPLLKKLGEDIQIVLLPRDEMQKDHLKQLFEDKNVIIPEEAVDGASLLYYSTLLIGGGGTMNAEAALLGTPVISMYPGPPTYVEKYLMKKKLIFREKSIEGSIQRAVYIVRNKKLREEIRKRGRNLLRQMENPIDKIFSTIIREVA